MWPLCVLPCPNEIEILGWMLRCVEEFLNSVYYRFIAYFCARSSLYWSLINRFMSMSFLLCCSSCRQSAERDFGPGFAQRLLWPRTIAPKWGVWGGGGRARRSCSSWIVTRAGNWSRFESFSKVFLHHATLHCFFLKSFFLHRNWNNWGVHRAHCSGNNRGGADVLMSSLELQINLL